MSPQNLSVAQIQRLRDASRQLLQLHKLLLDTERCKFEQAHGPIRSPGEFLNLVLSHQQFEWLRQLSGMIVQMDELAAPRSKAGPEEYLSTVQQARELLAPSETGTDFQQKYWKAMQDSPDIVLAHRDLTKALAPEA